MLWICIWKFYPTVHKHLNNPICRKAGYSAKKIPFKTGIILEK